VPGVRHKTGEAVFGQPDAVGGDHASRQRYLRIYKPIHGTTNVIIVNIQISKRP
jgi:hypothetical protein